MAGALELHARCFGDSGRDLIFLHGLFGSSANWGSIAQSFSDRYRVHVIDLRNHGASPHADFMSYTEMSADVVRYLRDHCQREAAILVGHSMGGKVAMELALSQPEKVAAVVVEDIAPVSYQHDYQFIVDALMSLPLSLLKSRADADTFLSEQFDDVAMRAFLLQNLARKDGAWTWRLNLSALSRCMPEIHSFRSIGADTFSGPSCFIHGQDSDYVGDREVRAIQGAFPKAEIYGIGGVGHWVHAEAKEQFLLFTEGFLLENNGI